ncbi:MAG: GNAT family N-acetyltransferase [Gaiellaceae bacterium]
MTELRPPVPSDAALVAQLRSRYAPELLTAERVLREWAAPGFDLGRDARIGDGGYVAAAWDADTDIRTWIELHGDEPEALLQWALDRATAPRVFSGGWEDARQEKRAIEDAGFRLVRHSYRMAIDLHDAPTEPALPGDLELDPFVAGDERAVYDVHMETFEDSWEHLREPYERWRHWTIERPGFDPDLWLLARDGEEIAGIVLGRVHEEDPTIGWVAVLGVRRGWRRRGLGEALLRAAFATLHRRGCRRIVLGVDAESLTGAHRLYERVGMHVAARFDVYEKLA